MDHASNSVTCENNSYNAGVPQRQCFRIFIIPKKGDGVFGYISHDGSIKKKLALVGDVSHNVHLPHKTQYSVGILSFSSHLAEAELKIEGKFIGIFYLEAYKFVEIERPPCEDKGFVFTSICENSSEAAFGRSLKHKIKNYVSSMFI